MSLRQDADYIIKETLAAVQPDAAVKKALQIQSFHPQGRLVLVSIGKAAWQMAAAAYETLQDRISDGIVITKYHHCKGEIGPLRLREAGHPIPDASSFAATAEALELVRDLTAADTVLFLISGGGSALFEQPLIPEDELTAITRQLLSGGAAITEINTIRKRLSAVKGGRFAELAKPAQVVSVVLSDIIGDPLDMIASGPAYPDRSTCTQALAIAETYQLTLSPAARRCLENETPKELFNVTTYINGSVRELCHAAARAAESLGYQPLILTDQLDCEASEAGRFFGAIARTHQESSRSLAFIAGGETVVHLKGNGSGGRNQELTLAASLSFEGLQDTCLFSLGSDGTDGPTDAAGGYVDSEHRLPTDAALAYLANNDAYHALAKTDGLLMTGPTGTNVNDVTVLLLKRS